MKLTDVCFCAGPTFINLRGMTVSKKSEATLGSPNTSPNPQMEAQNPNLQIAPSSSPHSPSNLSLKSPSPPPFAPLRETHTPYQVPRSNPDPKQSLKWVRVVRWCECFAGVSGHLGRVVRWLAWLRLGSRGSDGGLGFNVGG